MGNLLKYSVTFINKNLKLYQKLNLCFILNEKTFEVTKNFLRISHYSIYKVQTMRGLHSNNSWMVIIVF